ncbi:hypothetical protein ACS0PU_012502 [Formica fusca]
MSLKQLRKEATPYEISILNDRAGIINAFMTHYENFSSAAHFLQGSAERTSQQTIQPTTASGISDTKQTYLGSNQIYVMHSLCGVHHSAVYICASVSAGNLSTRSTTW